jgi:hypothetical protein
MRRRHAELTMVRANPFGQAELGMLSVAATVAHEHFLCTTRIEKYHQWRLPQRSRRGVIVRAADTESLIACARGMLAANRF